MPKLTQSHPPKEKTAGNSRPLTAAGKVDRRPPAMVAKTWPKGVSGNPRGRPKEIVRPLVRELMQKTKLQEVHDLAKHTSELTPAQATAVELVSQSLTPGLGQLSSLHALVELVDGRQAQVHTGADGEPLSLSPVANILVLLADNGDDIEVAARQLKDPS